MARRLNLRFTEYKLPEDPKGSDRWAIVVSELLRLRAFRAELVIPVDPDAVDLLTQAGNKVKIDAATLGRKTSAPFVVVKSSHTVSGRDLVTDIELKEQKPTLFQRWYASWDDVAKVTFAVLAIFLAVGLPVAAVLLVGSYPEPVAFWAFVGQYIRPVVGWSLALLALGGVFWVVSKLEARPALQDVLGIFFGMLVVGAPVAWSIVSVPPEPLTGTQESYAAYLDHLISQVATLTPMLAGALPWLLLFLRTVGAGLLASMVELAHKHGSEET